MIRTNLMNKIFALSVVLALTACSCSSGSGADTGGDRFSSGDQTYAPSAVRRVLDRQQKAAFEFFYNGADPQSGMAYEGNNRGNTVTTGGSGFGVMALIVGVERGWITREEGTGQLRKIVDFLTEADRYKGAWSHWYSPDGSYVAFGDQKATGDLVESSFMMAGLLAAYEYFDGTDDVESGLREDIDNLYRTVDWSGYTGENGDGLYWLWYSETDTYSLKISGWNEALVTYLMALAAPEGHCIDAETYRRGWNLQSFPQRKTYGYELPLGNELGGPLFFSHYTFLGFDPRFMQDDKAWYWRQNLSHTMVNRHYCIHSAPETYDYGVDMWGLTACYGAGSSPNYSARNPQNDDGVIAPTAALSAYPYTPFYSTQVLLNMDRISECQGEFGLADAYKPSEKAANRDHLAIDQGPIVVMIENYRSGLIWNLLMSNDHVKAALEKAGIGMPSFEDGFPFANIETGSGYMDMMQHPDREKYELDYYLGDGGTAKVEVVRESTGECVYSASLEAVSGLNSLAFGADRVTRGEKYFIRLTAPGGKIHQLPVILH